MMELFTAPWPGPGNSEGPVDPDGWRNATGEAAGAEDSETPLLIDLPWPGPGDSEA